MSQKHTKGNPNTDRHIIASPHLEINDQKDKTVPRIDTHFNDA